MSSRVRQWDERPAEDYCLLVTDGTHDSPQQADSDCYLITSRHLGEYCLDLPNAYTISESDAAKINERSRVEQWDILYSMIGTVGSLYQERGQRVNYVIKNIGLFKLSGDRLSSTWLYYYLKSPDAKAYISANLRGTTQEYVTLGALRRMPVPAPDRPEKEAVTATLSCLDDKIEVNNLITKTLEGMAQAIFRSWFIDFDPFMNGEFVASELGPIPKEWRVGTLDDAMIMHDARRVPLSSRQRATMLKRHPYYGAASVVDFVEDYLFDGTHVLLGEDGTVVTKDGYPVLQYVWGRFWVNNHAHVLTGANGFNEESLYLLLQNSRVSGVVTGAVQPKISQSSLRSIRTLLPPAEVLAQFNNLIAPLFLQKRSLTEENHALAAVRDSLLPKLMSGEIRVPLDEVEVN